MKMRLKTSWLGSTTLPHHLEGTSLKTYIMRCIEFLIDLPILIMAELFAFADQDEERIREETKRIEDERLASLGTTQL